MTSRRSKTSLAKALRSLSEDERERLETALTTLQDGLPLDYLTAAVRIVPAVLTDEDAAALVWERIYELSLDVPWSDEVARAIYTVALGEFRTGTLKPMTWEERNDLALAEYARSAPVRRKRFGVPRKRFPTLDPAEIGPAALPKAPPTPKPQPTGFPGAANALLKPTQEPLSDKPTPKPSPRPAPSNVIPFDMYLPKAFGIRPRAIRLDGELSDPRLGGYGR
jgi:hypothetical protein